MGDDTYTPPSDKVFGPLSSSVDSTKLSKTIEGILNVIAGISVAYGIITVEDSTTLLAQVPLVVNEVLMLVPIVYAVWHCGVVVFGILRKGVAAIGKRFARA